MQTNLTSRDERASIDIFDFFEIIKARWRFIIIISLLFAVAYGLYIAVTPKQSEPEPVTHTRMTSYAELVAPYPTEIAEFHKKRAQIIALLSPSTNKEINLISASLEEAFLAHTIREASSYIQRTDFLSKTLDYYRTLVSTEEADSASRALFAANSSVFEVTAPPSTSTAPVIVKYSTLVPGVAQKALAKFLEQINSAVIDIVNNSMNVAIDAEIAILQSQRSLLTARQKSGHADANNDNYPPEYYNITSKIKALAELKTFNPKGVAFSYRAKPANEYSASGNPVTKPVTPSKFLMVALSGIVGAMLACIMVLIQYGHQRRRENHR